MATLSTSYTFSIEDTTRPNLVDILWINPRKCRLQFSEPMSTSDAPGGTLFMKHIAGLVEIGEGSVLQLSGTTPSAAWIGYPLQITGSAYPQNNQTRTVSAVDPAARTIALADLTHGPMVADDGVDKNSSGNVIRTRTLRLTISPYAFTANLDVEGASADPESADRVQCAYLPLQVSSSLPLAEELPTGRVPAEYVILNFHDDVSIRRVYTVEVHADTKDSVGNVISTSTKQYTTPRFGIPSNRVNLWDLFPEKVREEDLANDAELRKMAIVLADLQNVLGYRIDQLTQIPDPSTCPTHLLDFMLHRLGNPFTYNVNTEQKKRRLAASLKKFYRKLGTKSGIEDLLGFFLGGTFDINPFINAGTWFLGSGILGVDTVLGTGSAYYRNCYQVISYRALTAEERAAIVEIATWADPVNMHLLSIVEPGSGAEEQIFWILGSGILGQSTMLNT